MADGSLDPGYIIHVLSRIKVAFDTDRIYGGFDAKLIVEPPATLPTATQNYNTKLTEERLFNWHGSLFPTGRSVLSKITVLMKDEGGGRSTSYKLNLTQAVKPN